MNVVIFGNGGHASVAADILEQMQNVSIICHIDKETQTEESHISRTSYPIFCLEQFSATHNLNDYYALVAIGDNFLRAKIVHSLADKYPNLRYATAIHPNAMISKKATVGAGTIIMAGVSVNAYTEIKSHCILNTNASIDHDCYLGNYSSVGPNCGLGGEVKLGEYSMLGIGTNVVHQVEIGSHTVVGAGTTVTRNLDVRAVYVGQPARMLRTREVGEPYL